jgi:hypothetical protein
LPEGTIKIGDILLLIHLEPIILLGKDIENVLEKEEKTQIKIQNIYLFFIQSAVYEGRTGSKVMAALGQYLFHTAKY